MPRLRGKVPAYRLHRASGQALVTLNGRDHYLGPHGTEASRMQYDRLVCEWLSRGRAQPAANGPAQEAPAMTVDQVIHAFWQHALVYYRKPDGAPTSELDNLKQALRVLRRLYGTSDAADFGPKRLKAVREQMITRGWCRSNINQHVGRIKAVFRWAVENELLPAPVFQALLRQVQAPLLISCRGKTAHPRAAYLCIHSMRSRAHGSMEISWLTAAPPVAGAMDRGAECSHSSRRHSARDREARNTAASTFGTRGRRCGRMSAPGRFPYHQPSPLLDGIHQAFGLRSAAIAAAMPRASTSALRCNWDQTPMCSASRSARSIARSRCTVVRFLV
jgi:hypothetical protein